MTGEYIQDAKVRPGQQLQGPYVELILNDQGRAAFRADHRRQRQAAHGDRARQQRLLGAGDPRADRRRPTPRSPAASISRKRAICRSSCAPARCRRRWRSSKSARWDLRWDATRLPGFDLVCRRRRVGNSVHDCLLQRRRRGGGCGAVIQRLFMVAILAGFQAVLTLPGIAGIVLTIGMAVDANVLINERIREEMRAGRGGAFGHRGRLSKCLAGHSRIPTSRHFFPGSSCSSSVPGRSKASPVTPVCRHLDHRRNRGLFDAHLLRLSH